MRIELDPSRFIFQVPVKSASCDSDHRYLLFCAAQSVLL